MFTSIKNDTINLNDVSRISREHNILYVYFISRKDPLLYHFELAEHAQKVDMRIIEELRVNNKLA